MLAQKISSVRTKVCFLSRWQHGQIPSAYRDEGKLKMVIRTDNKGRVMHSGYAANIPEHMNRHYEGVSGRHAGQKSLHLLQLWFFRLPLQSRHPAPSVSLVLSTALMASVAAAALPQTTSFSNAAKVQTCPRTDLDWGRRRRRHRRHGIGSISAQRRGRSAAPPTRASHSDITISNLMPNIVIEMVFVVLADNSRHSLTEMV